MPNPNPNPTTYLRNDVLNESTHSEMEMDDLSWPMTYGHYTIPSNTGLGGGVAYGGTKHASFRSWRQKMIDKN